MTHRNSKQNKYLVLNKADRHINHIFKRQEYNIEYVQHCRYLGIYITASGIFSLAKTQLLVYNKAFKPYLKLQKKNLSMNPKVKTCLNVFHHTLTQGCGIRGSLNCKSSKF